MISCIDIDECEEENPCEDIEDCINSEGSYTCQKKEEYQVGYLIVYHIIIRIATYRAALCYLKFTYTGQEFVSRWILTDRWPMQRYQ